MILSPFQPRDQQALRALLIYRLLLAGSLLAVIYSGQGMHLLAESHPTLFIWTGHLYLMLALLSGLALKFRWFGAATQAHALFLADAIAIPLLMHAGIGVSSGMGILLAVSIALTSLVLPGRLVLFHAAVATFGLFSGIFFFRGVDDLSPGDLTNAGLLGAAFFVIATLAAILSHRAGVSESLVRRQAADLDDLSRLNELIIQEMATGVVAADDSGHITFLNDAARRLLRIPPGEPIHSLERVAPDLDTCRSRWLRAESNATRYQVKVGRQQLRALFRQSGMGNNRAPLIFLEDASEAIRQAQQIKLASLGRLTASVAHQIRNPLSSISHAGQLLAESPHIADADRRLTEIIRNNTARVNEIIESILQLSRRTESTKGPVVLGHWLDAFINDYPRLEGKAPHPFLFSVTEAARGQTALVDALQLDQILFNLCDNAHRHFIGPPAALRIELRLDLNSYGELTLDILDNGPGFGEEARERLFEPFFTTRGDGTGLGLYIAKELSDANQIDLTLIPRAGGAHFRLRFPSNNG
ncbi:MAG: PAS domain-containing protein [Gammaproteobacteria bacterium]|nr:PAS domain-containing protein [Gammaproteobacteria bacterium]MBU1655206.1 PAS domain-containing protein [Gammaproteobacteria bacterium]MBU1959927.1 PAS domain-containing protein [Gammaproteobacteria bacterium]